MVKAICSECGKEEKSKYVLPVEMELTCSTCVQAMVGQEEEKPAEEVKNES